MSLVPVPSEQAGATCAHCGAALVSAQRYCLSCGQPASPVRLAFLDVLQNDPAPAGIAQATLEMTPTDYVPLGVGRGANGWLRRNSGLLSLLAVLVLCLIAGLLVGHWVGQSNKTPSKQVVEVKGLSGLAAPVAAATTPASSAAGGATETPTKATAKEEAEAKKAEAKETKAEKAPPPPPKKVAPEKIKKLTNSSGAQHQKEINELGAQPIETG